MADLKDLGGLGGLGSFVSAGIGAFDYITGTSRKRSMEDSKELMALQQQYNLENMAKEQEYAKEMVDYQGPAHMMALAEQAGLNPLLVAQGNMNLSGGSSASSQSIDVAGAASAAEQRRANDLAQQFQIAQIANLNSQTKLNNVNAGKSAEDIKTIISNRKISEEQHAMTMKMQDYEFTMLYPVQHELTKKQAYFYEEQAKVFAPQIDLLKKQYDECVARINSLEVNDKIKLAETWMRLDKHQLEKAFIKAGISKYYSDMLVNDANIDYIHQMGKNLQTQGSILALDLKFARMFGKDKAFADLRSIELSNDAVQIDNRTRGQRNSIELERMETEMFKNVLSPIGTAVGVIFGLGLGSKVLGPTINKFNSSSLWLPGDPLPNNFIMR